MQKRSEAVKEVIIDASSRSFREVGYMSASVDSIAKLAGVSKATLYSHFSNKEGLFRATVEAFVAPILEVVPSAKPSADVRDELTKFAQRISNMLLTPEKLEWDRMMVATAKTFPNLARDYFKAGPERALRQLGEFLQVQSEAGTLHVEDARFSAEMFCGMLFGTRILRNLIFAQAAPLEPSHISRSIDAFLKVHTS